jgi:hypothetical protein
MALPILNDSFILTFIVPDHYTFSSNMPVTSIQRSLQRGDIHRSVEILQLYYYQGYEGKT